MQLKTYIESDYKIVEITGPLSRRDENEILLVLSQPLVKKVFFRGIFVLTEIIIRKLVQMRQKHSIKIKTDEIFLSAYLNRLELRTLYVKDDNLVFRLEELSQIKMIALTGSADSTHKIREVIRELPFFAGLSLCIVQHIPRKGELTQVSLWQPLTKYKVQYAADGMEVAGGAIYLARPNHHLRIKGGIFRLEQDKTVCYARPSIDVTLCSLADEYGSRALGIVFCG
ncbi:hypothetical protein KAJ27_04655, partial [bacterium]|nr:hypothetical protein [bacterium]